MTTKKRRANPLFAGDHLFLVWVRKKGTKEGWCWCQKCYRSWRIGAKRLPRCAPRTIRDGYPNGG